jgi:hypothetical protein
MNKPLPIHFQLSEAELSALQEQCQDLKARNERIKGLVVLVLTGVIYGPFYVMLGLSSWRQANPWILLWALPLSLMLVIMSSAIAGGLTDRPLLIRPFLRKPDERMKRYAAFREEELKFEIWLLRTQEDFWNSLSGTEFEHEVVALLNRAGYAAQLTAGSGDGGVDIVLDGGTIIQCKARRGPCGPAILRELYGSLHDFGAQKAILISREGFTRASLEFAEGKPIDLWDRSTLIALQRGLK